MVNYWSFLKVRVLLWLVLTVILCFIVLATDKSKAYLVFQQAILCILQYVYINSVLYIYFAVFMHKNKYRGTVF